MNGSIPNGFSGGIRFRPGDRADRIPSENADFGGDSVSVLGAADIGPIRSESSGIAEHLSVTYLMRRVGS